MRKKSGRGLVVAAAVVALPCLPSAAHAGNATWTGSTSNAWEDSSNWNPASSPGALNPLGSATNTDLATFNTSTANNNPTPDAGVSGIFRNLKSITFDTGSAGAFTIGSIGGNTLALSDAGTIQMTSSVVNIQTVNAPLLLVGNYAFLNSSSTSTKSLIIGGSVTGSTATTQTLTLSGTNTSSNSISGNITDGSGGGKLAVAKTAAGVWVLSGTNGYTGGTTASAGNLVFSNTGAVGGTGANVTVNAGGAVAWSLASGLAPDLLLSRIVNTSSGSLALPASSAVALDFSSYPNLMLGATATATYSGTITPGSGGYRFGGGNATLTVSSKLTGASTALTIGTSTSSGNVALSNNTNDFGGATTINAGSLNVSNPGQLGAGTSITVVASGAALTLTAGGIYGTGMTLNITGTGVNSVGALTSSTGTGAIWAGNVNIATDQARIGDSLATGTIDVQGVISGVAGAAPVVRGTNNNSIVQFSNANTYTGTNTGIVVGTLKLNHSGALPSTTAVTFGNNSNTGTGVALNLNGVSTTLLGVATVASNNIASDITSATAAVLTVGNSTTNYAYGDVGTVASNPVTVGTISGAIALVKTGTNTQTLGGLPNTYTGGTTITGGTLAIGTTAVPAVATLGSGDVTVTPAASAGATLDLSGANPGAGGVINDGATLTLSNSGTFFGHVAFGNNTLDEIVGALVINGTSEPAGTYTSTNLPSFITGNGSITVAVPEPATAGMLAAGAALGLLRRRRLSGKI